MTNTPDLSRRSLLLGTAAVGAAGAATLAASPAARAVPKSQPGRFSYPFTLGIASGDPLPDGFVLWTRLAPNPLAEDGMGGMPNEKVRVEFQISETPTFAKLVRFGTKHARAEEGHSVRVIVTGLEPGREYYYRFRLDEHLSPVGRTLTAPAPGTMASKLMLGIVSCSQFEHGWFTAYRRLAEEMPDLVVHLGDYFYEYQAKSYNAPGGNVRDHLGPETTGLAGYRQRHAQYKTDEDLQALHAAAPMVVVFDDHEVENNWAGDVSENDEPLETWRQRRAAAFQAYYENMPLRRMSDPSRNDYQEIQLYRSFGWGKLANFHMLDTRQFRSDQACGDGWKQGCEAATDPTRSITGIDQERWLLKGLKESDATWDVLGQQVFFARRDREVGEVEELSMDSWDGYQASRARIMEGFGGEGAANPVVLTGDVHTHWASDLKADFYDADSRTVGVELVTTSITSGGDGNANATTPALQENEHIKYFRNQRGYITATFTEQEMRADFKVLPYVKTAGAPVVTDASFVSEAGNPGLHSA